MHNQSVFLNIIFSSRSQTTHLRVASASCSSFYAKSGTLQDFVCGFWKKNLWSLENGDWGFLDQSGITSKVLSFLQFFIAMMRYYNNKQTKHYLSKICWLHAAILAKVYLTWLTYTSKYIFLQLWPNCLKNMLKQERKVKLLEAKEGCGPEQVRWWWLTCPRPTESGWSLPLPRTFRPDADFDFF